MSNAELIAEARVLDAAAMPGPWKSCGRDDVCMCGFIWSVPIDCPVMHAEAFDDNPYEEGPTHASRSANARLVARYRTLCLELADALERVSTDQFCDGLKPNASCI